MAGGFPKTQWRPRTVPVQLATGANVEGEPYLLPSTQIPVSASSPLCYAEFLPHCLGTAVRLLAALYFVDPYPKLSQRGPALSFD